MRLGTFPSGQLCEAAFPNEGHKDGLEIPATAAGTCFRYVLNILFGLRYALQAIYLAKSQINMKRNFERVKQRK